MEGFEDQVKEFGFYSGGDSELSFDSHDNPLRWVLLCPF